MELLAVLGITGFLAVLCVGAVNRGIDSARQVREVNAARMLVTALHSYAMENDGRYLPGMDYRVGTPANPVYNPDGKLVLGHAAQRYPFRIAAYLDNELEGTIFVNRNKIEIMKTTGGGGPMYDYIVSTYPALGMNVFGVGGVVLWDGKRLYDDDCIAVTAKTAGSVLAFASAGSGAEIHRRHGFSYVSPPTNGAPSPYSLEWEDVDAWKSEADPMYYGWVDFRYDGKAVAGFLDGSVRLCSVEELSDMRLWTIGAIEANDPNYKMVK